MAFALASWSALLPATRAEADDVRPPAVVLSMLDTLLLAGDYEVSIADASLRAGPAAGLALFADGHVLAPLELGVQALVLQRDSDDPQLAHSTLMHFGGHVGAAFMPRDGVLLGAAALIGVHKLDFRDAQATTTGLGLGLLGHADVRLYECLWLRGQVGALWQPTGGHRATDVSMPPTPFFGLGFALGFPT
jgi:hypothetical protein